MITVHALADGLAAEDAATITSPVARGFRAFAESTGADRLALAAVLRADPWSKSVDWDAIRCPTLVLVGDRDDLVGSPDPLAAKTS